MSELIEVVRDVLKKNGIHAWTDHTDKDPVLSDHLVTSGEIESGIITISIELPERAVASTALKDVRNVMKILKFNGDEFHLISMDAFKYGRPEADGNGDLHYDIDMKCQFIN